MLTIEAGMTIAQTRALLALSFAMVACVALNLVVLQRRDNGGAGRLAAAGDIQAQIAADAQAAGRAKNANGTGAALRAGASGGRADPEGDLVRAIQRELAVRKYALGAADGVPGLMTRAAILAFEFDHGHALTAEPSDALLKSILIGTPGSGGGANRAPSERARQLIATVQASLSALGYAGAGNDGRLGEATRRAIREFEMDRGLPRSGRISPVLIQELALAARKGKMNRAAAKPPG